MPMRGHVAKKGNKYYIVVDSEKDEATGKRKQKWLSGYDKKRAAERALPTILAQLMNGTC
jgi:integrase